MGAADACRSSNEKDPTASPSQKLMTIAWFRRYFGIERSTWYMFQSASRGTVTCFIGVYSSSLSWKTTLGRIDAAPWDADARPQNEKT